MSECSAWDLLGVAGFAWLTGWLLGYAMGEERVFRRWYRGTGRRRSEP